MKKIALVSFVIAAMIFLGTNVNSSVRVINKNNSNSTAQINYQVNIHPNWIILHNQCPIWVMMTDGTNTNILGLPQLYNPEINTYHFYEMGPVYGI